MSYCKWQQDQLLLWVKVQTKSSKNTFAEASDNEIKVRITAPPVDGKANAHLTAWLAKQFGVAKSSVKILSGETSRHKKISIKQPQKIPTHIVVTTPASG